MYMCMCTHIHAWGLSKIKIISYWKQKQLADRQYFVSIPQTPISTGQCIRDQEVLAHAMGCIPEEEP